jgi:hypothetical protein
VGDKDETVYLGGKNDEQRAEWANDKTTVNAKFVDTLVEEASKNGIRMTRASGPGPAPSPFTVRAHATWIEPGYVVPPFGAVPAHMKLEVQIVAQDGHVVDTILTEPQANFVTAHMRLSAMGEFAGTATARYLATRTISAQ